MMATAFPLEGLGEQATLLTAIVLGFGFGFALERAGFGNARKLAAQFYLTDMSVFKVMFTAILVAMVGFHSGVALGWIDVSRMWINPTFLWAQVLGGFLLGVGFILSGLCPGTSVVSMASGRLDGAFTFAGVFFGSFLFALLVDRFPWVQQLYHGSSWGVSLLPALWRIPAPWMAAGVVVMAGLAFAGAEKVEKHFGHAPVQAGEARLRRAWRTDGHAGSQGESRAFRWGLVGALAIVALVSGWPRSPASSLPAEATAPRASLLSPRELAEALVSGDTAQLLLNLDPEAQGRSIPGAVSGADGAVVQPLLESLPEGWRVVVFDADGRLTTLPSEWPSHLDYRIVDGGYAAWEREVLTPRERSSVTPAERASVLRQNALAAYFSGAQLDAVSAPPPPPPVPSGKTKNKKKPGGC